MHILFIFLYLIFKSSQIHEINSSQYQVVLQCVFVVSWTDPWYLSSSFDPQGKNLNLASSEEDVQVYVGKEAAVVQGINQEFLTVKIPANKPELGDFNNGNNTEEGGHPVVYVSFLFVYLL